MTYADVNDAYEKGRYHIAPYRKLRGISSYTAADLSYGAGIPIANYYASTPLVQATLPSNEGIFHGGGVDKYLHKISIQQATGSVGALTLLDYVSYIPFLDGDSTDKQVLNTNQLPRFSDGAGIQVMLVSQGQGTAYGNATLKYTNQDGVTGRTAITSVDGSSGVGTIISPNSKFLQLQQGDSGVQAIESITFATGIGGIYALIFVKPIITFGIQDITAPLEKDFFTQSMTMPKIHKDAYLNLIFKSMSAGTTTLQAQLEFIW